MGVLDGLLSGAASGGAAGGPTGAAIGAGLSLATGLIQNLQASKLKKQADSMAPELTDPNQAAFLAELNQKRKSLASGAAFGESVRQADLSQAAANNAITQGAGGDSGATIQGLLQSQAIAGNTKNAALANGEGEQLAYDTAYGNQLNKISSRILQLQLAPQNQKRAEWARKKTFAGQNLNAGIAGAAGLLANRPGTNPAPNMSFNGTDDVSLTGKPASGPLNTFMPTGETAPGVTPELNLANQGLGELMSFMK